MYTFSPDTKISSSKVNANFAALADGSAITDISLAGTDISNPYKFSVYRNAAWTTVNQLRTTIPFDTARFDTNGNFDIVTNKGRYTAPVSGFYFFNARMGSPISGYKFLELYVNGVKVREGSGNYYTTAQTVSVTISALVQLTAGDYVEIKYYTDGAQVHSVVAGEQAYFDGFLISRT